MSTGWAQVGALQGLVLLHTCLCSCRGWLRGGQEGWQLPAILSRVWLAHVLLLPTVPTPVHAFTRRHSDTRPPTHSLFTNPPTNLLFINPPIHHSLFITHSLTLTNPPTHHPTPRLQRPGRRADPRSPHIRLPNHACTQYLSKPPINQTRQPAHPPPGSSGPAVVLIHGYGGSCYHWRSNIPQLARHCRWAGGVREVLCALHCGWHWRSNIPQRARHCRLVEGMNCRL